MISQHDLGLLGSARNNFNESIIKSKDRIISEAISRCIGDDWSIGEIQGRCHSTTETDNICEVFYIDNRPIVQFYKSSFAVEDDGLSHLITSEFTYRFIGRDCRGDLCSLG